MFAARRKGGRHEPRAAPLRHRDQIASPGARPRRPVPTLASRTPRSSRLWGGMTWTPSLSRAWLPEARGRRRRTLPEPAWSAPLRWQRCGERRGGWSHDAGRSSTYAEGSHGREPRSVLGPVRFRPYSPRQGDDMAKAHQDSLSESHSQRTAESFNSSLAHNDVWSPDYIKSPLTRTSVLVSCGLPWTRMAFRGLPFPTYSPRFPTYSPRHPGRGEHRRRRPLSTRPSFGPLRSVTGGAHHG
mgnify:FL=1